ncbi:MAG TPA: hypothetical protein VJV05_06605, partial [Pyrinomonadaceae bacterium]|nr:hypothetical protein [Pyrinomonadaceae bacterium]
DFRAATSTLAKLVHEFPKSKLTEGARRLLAITYEDKGDLESALDQYFELDYKIDAAYFVDVLMPTERLAKYVAGRPTIPQHNVLMYSLAVRYLRDNKLTEARSTLEKVDTKFAFRKDDFDPTNKPRSPKHPYWRETSEPFIDTSWVMQDLKTIETLRHLAESVEVAKGDEDRAEAMYQLGSYYFESSSLLFYNPAMWDGMRYQELSELDYANRYRLRQEASTVFDHFQSHDTLARAISMYMDLVNRYPNSRAAKDALYSAAVAHERLSDLNPYWRSIYGQGLFAGPRKVTYQDVRSAYPKYQLPKATYGWEPGTRTVNGGTGWAPPPKPLPRETKEHRIKRLLREGATTVSDYANKVLPKIETKVDGGINWYASAIEAAVYGIASGIGLWAIVLVGIGLHARRHSPESIAKVDEPANTDSRVDKFLK